MGVNKNKNFKICEKMLYAYKNIDAKIENLNLEIQELNDRAYADGIGYGDKSSKTYKFSSMVENKVIEWEDEEVTKKIRMLQYKISNLQREKQRIDIVRKTLNKEETKILEMRYLAKDKASWVAVGMALNIEKSWLFVIRNRMINRICEYLFLNESNEEID